MYEIELGEQITDTLKDLRAYDRKRILDKIEEQLTFEPAQETKNKKPVIGLKPPWEQEGPVWELRIEEFRAFYEINGPRNPGWNSGVRSQNNERFPASF